MTRRSASAASLSDVRRTCSALTASPRDGARWRAASSAASVFWRNRPSTTTSSWRMASEASAALKGSTSPAARTTPSKRLRA